MAAESDRQFMIRAIELAARGRGYTSPNPMVGAVLVKSGKVIGEGYHRRPGTQHAEIAAIRAAGGKASGAILYVNLEPCCHSGRTGPCAEAIAEAGIKRVVAATRDINPLVSGRGFSRLRKSGIEVETGLLRSEAMRLNEAYFTHHREKRPFVILKSAQSLDGRVATSTGDSKWISSEKSLVLAHRLRAEVDGVLVGMGTARSDDPALTVRHVKGRNPYRIVLSKSLCFPRKSQLLDANEDGLTIIASEAAAIEKFTKKRRAKNLIFWDIKRARDGRLSLVDLLKKADQFGLQSLLIEGGSQIATSFIKAGLVDKYILVTAPLLIGSGMNVVGDLGIRRLARAVRFGHSSFYREGTDSIFVGYPNWKVK